jgi:HEAT repeat protein
MNPRWVPTTCHCRLKSDETMTGPGVEVTRLVWELRSRNPLVRGRAAAELASLRPAEAVLPLVELLRDRHDRVRTEAARALGEIGDARALRGLCASLEDSQAEVRSAAVTALCALGAGATRALCEALRSGRPGLRTGVTEALLRIGPEAVPDLIRLLGAPVWEVRRQAVLLLARIGDRRAVPALIGRLSDETPWVRGDAAEALGWIGDPEAVGALTRSLSDEREFVRVRAVAALGVLTRWKCVDPFLPLLSDPATPVREAAAVELGRQADARAILPLVRAVEAGVGAPAVEALAEIAARDPAPELRAALPVLRRLAPAQYAAESGLFYSTIARIEQVTAEWQNLPVPAGDAAPQGNLPAPAMAPTSGQEVLSVEDELERLAENAELLTPEETWKQRAARYVGKKLRGE